MGFIERPRRVWWRKALFQVHLWVGVALCLYMFVIGVSGSILVFESELEHAVYPHLWHSSGKNPFPDHPAVDLPGAISAVAKAYPEYRMTAAYPPDRPGDNFEVFIRRHQEIRYVFVDANTGKIAGAINPDRSWLVWLVDLHFRLLAGHTGLILNGIGGICLLLLSATGLVIWWAGLKHWIRGLKVNFRKSWRRINFDLHNAIGFWTLLIVSMWAFTGAYFAWPGQIASFVNRFSSVASTNPPNFVVPPRSGRPWADMRVMIRRAEGTSPNAKFAGAFFPANDKGALTLLMARDAPRNFSQMDYIYFDPVTGKQLAVWHRGVNGTWGGKFIHSLGPLHYGYYWGLGIQILWALLGCALPVLAITGVLMYWNRYLKKRWKRIRTGSESKLLEVNTSI